MSKPQIVVTSGVAVADGKPFVTIAWGNENGQLDTEAVKQFALSLIEAAVEADRDAALAAWGRSQGMDTEDIARLLAALRKGRGEPPSRSGRAQS